MTEDAITFLEKHLLEGEHWYHTLVEDCKDIIVEGEFSWRMTILETYHNLGKRIFQDIPNFTRSQIYGDNIVQRVAESLQRSERTIYYAMKFAEKFPSVDEVPEGKNISWRLVCQKYLTKPKELPSHETATKKATEEYCLCPKCGSEIMPILTKCRCEQEFEIKAENIRRR